MPTDLEAVAEISIIGIPVQDPVLFPPVDVATLFPFDLDAFQADAIAALESGKSVVVVAPTGSGKTLIGEYAIAGALARGKRVFYTTPLKALSNQKLRDFRALYGTEQVGLVTGDLCINRDAPVLVMTTEIFRNILYGTLIDNFDPALDEVEAVVLDECHYMNDRQRGTVWEESIIYCPPEIQLIALSATIANAEQLTAWIEWVHGPTQLVHSDWRPVPLCFHFATAQGLFPLLNRQQTKINPRIKALPPQRGGGRSHRGRSATIAPSLLIETLQQREMLPAIYFLFSRRGCDQAVQGTQHLNLLTSKELTQLKQQVTQFLAIYPDLDQSPVLEGIYRGVAAHHAGLLPAWKALIEELFQQGLVKVIFATETLAAGINMPARTTIISSLSKRTDLGHRLLTASEFLQMSGRAGRRGMDTLGHVVTLQTAFEGATEAAYLATIGADALVSQFTPSYGMVLNLLQTHTLDEAKALIERSFGQYVAMQQLTPQQQAIADLEQELAAVETKAASVNLNALQQYSKLKGRLKEEQRLLKVLEYQAEELRQQYPTADEPPPEVVAQQQRLAAVQAQLEAHPAHATRKHHGSFLRLERRSERLQTQLSDRRAKLNRQSHQRWQDFLCLVKLLQEFGSLDGLQPTSLGKTAAMLRGENELWLALALRSGEFDDLDPHQLATACAALVSENNRSDSWTRYPTSPTVQQALDNLRSLRRQLIQAQHRENVVLPVWLEAELVGLVEQWALGTPWADLCANSSLDEGDMVRLLRRTNDILGQIPKIAALPEPLRLNARRAAHLIDRFPINEMEMPQNPATEPFLP
ncbi:MAG: DEAD/DEAH box helicase [Thermosynechococcaceae cyanobacterium]